jgi:hypothetical protein
MEATPATVSANRLFPSFLTGPAMNCNAGALEWTRRGRAVRMYSGVANRPFCADYIWPHRKTI